MESILVKNALLKRANELGFDALRIARPEKIEKFERDFFINWLNENKCDEMLYLKNNLEKRLYPSLLFPQVKSIVVVSAGFFRESNEKRIALYAQGADYHKVIKNKLLDLENILKEYGGVQKLCVDTVPIMEKYFAIKSGIGWRGKNSLVISEKNGPWQFLALILTSLELEEDSPVKNRCGKCVKCLQACPTCALNPNSPYSIDARICISNLTIERKTPLSESEKLLVKDKFFGCDECLRACPFGKTAPISNIEEFRTSIELPENINPEDAKDFIDSKRARNLSLRRK